MNWKGAVAAIVLLGSATGVPAAGQDSLSKDLQVLSDLMARPLAQRGLRWQCVPSVRYVCTAEGCEHSPAVVSVRLDLSKRTYSRCEKEDCDSYPMTFSSSGIFTTFTLPGSGSTFLKVVNDGSEYLEVASLQLAVHQNFGTCRPSR